MELLQAAWAVIKELFQSEQSRAVALSLGVGGFLTEFVSRFLKPDMDHWQADRLVRLISLGIAWCTGFAAVPTVNGFLYGLLSGLAAPTVYSFVSRAIYARYPALKPEALKPCGASDGT